MTLVGNRLLPGNAETRWHVLPDQHALVAAVSERILGSAGHAIHERGVFRMVLAGGTTPAAVYARLTAADTDWSGWQIFYGDERCLPADHPERNSNMASEHWLQRVALPAANIHVIPAENGAEAAAQAYIPLVEQATPFDLVLLGMGEDGHTASLFPGNAALGDTRPVVPVHHAPKPPPERVSLGLATLQAAGERIVLVAGRDKHAALQRVRAGERLPIALAGPLLWFIDAEAGGPS